MATTASWRLSTTPRLAITQVRYRLELCRDGQQVNTGTGLDLSTRRPVTTPSLRTPSTPEYVRESPRDLVLSASSVTTRPTTQGNHDAAAVVPDDASLVVRRVVGLRSAISQVRYRTPKSGTEPCLRAPGETVDCRTRGRRPSPMAGATPTLIPCSTQRKRAVVATVDDHVGVPVRRVSCADNSITQ
jgi:hypothetical protein